MGYDPSTTAVVVGDMQNGFCKPGGALYAEGSEQAIEPAARLVDAARDADVPVVFTRDVHTERQFEDNDCYDEFERWGVHQLEGSWDTDVVEEIPVREDDHVVTKHTYDAFYMTDLDGHLSVHDVTTLLVCGTLANVCVLYLAMGAGIRDYCPVVVEDAVGYVEEEHREYAVAHIEWLFEEVTTVADVEFE